jgi:hypothetical protein
MLQSQPRAAVGAFLLSTSLTKYYDVTIIDADPNHPIKSWAEGATRRSV